MFFHKNHIKMSLTKVLLALTIIGIVDCLPGGAPTGSCTTMTPRHNDGSGGLIATQSGASTYSVMANSTIYRTGSTVRVWVADSRSGSSSGYRGLLLQARTVGEDTPVGSWKNAPNNTKLIQCSAANDAVTHSEVVMIKDSSTVYEWTATKNYNNIAFVATVAENHDVFWVKLSSETLQFNAGSNLSPPLILLILSLLALMSLQ